MTFGFNELQEFLADWPRCSPSKETVEDTLFERIRQVLLADVNGSSFAKSDLIPLIRHLLLRESSDSGHEKVLRVPKTTSWPSESEWHVHGISVISVRSEAFLLSAKPWFPEWLGCDERGAFADAFSKAEVREDSRCPVDPFIEDATGYAYYSSPGQREAIRATFLIPTGDTLIVNLPTGSGKSLVGQVPALVHRLEGHLTLFVVPTVALAIDQARQMRPYLRRTGATNQTWPLAWYGGLSDVERSEIRQRMLNGTQRILFTSPEALTTSLLRTVFEVSRNGMLRYLVIDEAHLITQWGDEFRPAFQMLAGLRNSLLRAAGNQQFRTLLLSATFTPETIDTLASLFGPPDRVQMVSAVNLRPEPQYWSYKADSAAEKRKCVLEALLHAPRPFILYVTTRHDALSWYQTLRSDGGYRRIRQFDGTTPDHERKEIIDAWVANKLDGIVATSAFGVGIDKPDVRTIIHAAIPETLDRFYQEVGRGGRDGRHSISLIVYDGSDWSLPKRMATPTLISNELGFSRWHALYGTRYDEDDQGLFRIDLEAVRVGLTGSNDENVRWNMRTLLLMSRAGLLSLEVAPSDREQTEDDEGFAPSLLATMATIKVRLLRHDHLLADTWEDVIRKSRTNTLASGTNNFGLLKKILQEGREMSEILAELYRSQSAEWPISVTRICGGCPADRFEKMGGTRYNVANATPVHRLSSLPSDKWRATFSHLDPRHVLVFYNPETQQTEIIRLLQWLVSECGVQEVSARDRKKFLTSTGWRDLYKVSPSGVVIYRDHNLLGEEPYSPLRRVTVFDADITAEQLRMALIIERPLHVVCYPTETRDPDHLSRRLIDTATHSIRLEQMIAVIHQ